MKPIQKSLNYLIPRLQAKARRIKSYIWKIRLGKCGGGLIIWGPCSIKTPRNLHVGKNLSINDYVYINALGGIEIGDDVSLSAGCMLISTKLDKNATPLNSKHISQPIKIGNNVQIGAGSIILPGVNINDNVIVGAGAIISKDIPNNKIARLQSANYYDLPAKHDDKL